MLQRNLLLITLIIICNKTMAHRLLFNVPILLLLSILLCNASAMRPAPFDKEYSYTDPNSGIRLVSTYGGFSTNGVTQVFGTDGNIIYEIPVFMGRRTPYLSPNGAVLILDGEIYYGSNIMSTSGDDTVVTTVYQDGSMWREVMYKQDLDGKMPTRVRGGGWAERNSLFTLNVSWDASALIYDMVDAETRIIPLPFLNQELIQ